MTKQIMAIALLILSITIFGGCNKSSKESEKKVQMTLIIEPELLSSGPASSPIFQYQATIQETNQKLTIPIQDIVGFTFTPGFRYTISVVRYEVQIGGVPTGESYYKLVEVLSKISTNEDPEDMTS